jgi:hypothetical protein
VWGSILPAEVDKKLERRKSDEALRRQPCLWMSVILVLVWLFVGEDGEEEKRGRKPGVGREAEGF